MSSRETRTLLQAAADRIGLDLIEKSGVAPLYLLTPRGGRRPRVTLFQTWHAEASLSTPAAVEGAERLALGAALAALEAVAADSAFGSADTPEAALVVAPGASMGSHLLEQALRDHRDQLQASSAFWIRIVPPPPERRRIFLGARGRMVLAIWSGEENPYRIRDRLVAELTQEAYGPRPLDFELLRKLAQSENALRLLREIKQDTSDWNEEEIRDALFAPRGEVARPAVSHPDRPKSWLTIEITEAMAHEAVARRARELAVGGRVDIVETFPWDRLNIHHPATQALVAVAKSRSKGAEIWPLAPWPSPSGLFTRTLGVGLAEWGVPLPEGAMIRFPKPEDFESIAIEVAEVLLRAAKFFAPDESAR